MKTKAAINKTRFFLPILFGSVIFLIGMVMNAAGNSANVNARDKSALDNFIASMLLLLVSSGANILFVAANAAYTKLTSKQPLNFKDMIKFWTIITTVFWFYNLASSSSSNEINHNYLNEPVAQKLFQVIKNIALINATVPALYYATKVAGIAMPNSELAQFGGGMLTAGIMNEVVNPSVPLPSAAVNAITGGAVGVVVGGIGLFATRKKHAAIDPSMQPLVVNTEIPKSPTYNSYSNY